MMSFVALCLDAESARCPDSIGLADENLDAQEWLKLYTSAKDARGSLLRDSEVDEIWVASADDMEPINLAAALKRDRQDCDVLLLAFSGTGSLLSRASAAGIDATLARDAFVERYAREKRRRASQGREAAAAVAAGAASVSEQTVPCAPSSLPAPKTTSASSAEKPAPRIVPWQRTAFSQPGETVRVQSGHEAFLLPVVSGSGGAGKSSVAVLAAVIAKEMGYSTLLVDFDLQFGDMREVLGVSGALSVDELLAAPARVSHLMEDGALPALLAAPRRIESCDEVMGEAGLVLDSVMPRFDVVVANTGAFWIDLHALLLERASKALFLVDQRASSLRACKHAVELCARCGIATNPFVFAVNRCAKGSSFTSMDVSCAMQGARAVELLDGGRDVEDLLSAGMPLELLGERNGLCTSIERVLSDFLSRPVATNAARVLGGSDSPKKLFGRKKPRGRRGSL